MRLDLLMMTIAGLLILPAGAQGQGAGNDCANASSQMEMNQCAAKQLSAADAELNMIYKELVHKLDSAGQGYVRDAQRAWVTFRDKECIARAGGPQDQGGSIWPMVVAMCRTELTKDRIVQLERQRKCPGGDLSCPDQ